MDDAAQAPGHTVGVALAAQVTPAVLDSRPSVVAVFGGRAVEGRVRHTPFLETAMGRRPPPFGATSPTKGPFRLLEPRHIGVAPVAGRLPNGTEETTAVVVVGLVGVDEVRPTAAATRPGLRRVDTQGDRPPVVALDGVAVIGRAPPVRLPKGPPVRVTGPVAVAEKGLVVPPAADTGDETVAVPGAPVGLGHADPKVAILAVVVLPDMVGRAARRDVAVKGRPDGTGAVPTARLRLYAAETRPLGREGDVGEGGPQGEVAGRPALSQGAVVVGRQEVAVCHAL